MSVKRLGKGLGALIPSGREQKIESQLLKVETESISKIKLKDVYPNPDQPRKQFLHAYKSEGKTKYKPVIGKARDPV